MTNIILGWPGGDPPLPWQKLTNHVGKYLRCTATVGLALVEGGSPTHPHVVINFQVGYNPEGPTCQYGSLQGSKKHNNHPLANSSVSDGNNNPSYQEFELIYMDAEVWAAQERRFPQNAILLSDAVISWASAQRYAPENGDNRLMKIGTSPGSQGGSSTEDHDVSVTLGTSSGSLSTFSGQVNLGNYDRYHDHEHAGNATSPAATTMPKRVQTRFYITTELTDRALQGVIAFFDGTPPSDWSIVSAWDACFIENVNTNEVVTGRSEHGHTGVNGTSGTGQTWNLSLVSQEGGVKPGYRNHSHPWSADLQESNHEPPFVNLVPAKLTTTLLHESSLTKTWEFKTLLQRSTGSTFSMGGRLKAIGDEPIDFSAAIQDTLEASVDMTGQIALLDQDETFDMSARAMVYNHAMFMAQATLIMTHAAWSMSARLIKPYAIPPPLMDVILKSFAEQLDILQMDIQSMDWENKIDFASSSELDEKWGNVYELPRYSEETDDEYKKRLKTHFKVMTGSGTRRTIEEVLDSIVDDLGATNAESVWPARLLVNFSTDKALRAATEFRWLIEDTLERMIAAGVTYQIYLPYVDWYMTTYLKGQDWIDWQMGAAVQKTIENEFYANARLTLLGISELDISARAAKHFDRTFRMRGCVAKYPQKQFDMRALCKKELLESWQMGCAARATKVTQLLMNTRLLHPAKALSISMTARNEKTFRRMFWMGAFNSLQFVAQVDHNALVQKNVRASFYFRGRSQKTQVATFGMSAVVIANGGEDP